MLKPRIVYKLTHEATGKAYIGSTANFHNRKLKHLNRLKNGTHHVRELQADYDLHDNKNISFCVLDTIRDYSEKDKEYEWMATCQTFDRSKGYNYADPKLPRKADKPSSTDT